MKEAIKDLIFSIAQGNSLESDAKFNDIMSAKVSDALNARQVELAHNMFAEPTADTEE